MLKRVSFIEKVSIYFSTKDCIKSSGLDGKSSPGVNRIILFFSSAPMLIRKARVFVPGKFFSGLSYDLIARKRTCVTLGTSWSFRQV